MKKLITILIFLGCLSCKEDPQPTSFQGVVVYEDDGVRFIDGTITILERSNSKNIGAGPNTSDFRKIYLDILNGQFNVNFDAKEDVTEYRINVSDTTKGILFEIEF